jgi:hypothetical protein
MLGEGVVLTCLQMRRSSRPPGSDPYSSPYNRSGPMVIEINVRFNDGARAFVRSASSEVRPHFTASRALDYAPPADDRFQH